MKKAVAIVVFIASVLLAGRELLLQFITIATNDPHKYQPILQQGLALSLAGLALLILFAGLAKGRWRFAATLPLGYAWVRGGL